MRGIDYFASGRLGVGYRPRSDEHFAAKAFRDCADPSLTRRYLDPLRCLP